MNIKQDRRMGNDQTIRAQAACHRWSRVERKVNCIKLFGQFLVDRDLDRQVADIQIRVAVLNRYTAFGLPVIVASPVSNFRVDVRYSSRAMT